MSRLLLVSLVMTGGVAGWIFATARADSHANVNLEGASDNTAALSSSTTGQPVPKWGDSVPPRWVLSPPETLPSPEPAAGLNPCFTPDPGFSSYEGWDESLPKGQMLWPKTPATDREGNIRVVFHFHGHEAVRKEWVQVTSKVALVALDLGNSSSSYAEEFANPSAFAALLQTAEQTMEQHLGRPVTIGKFGLSAWSAGYAAVRGILANGYQPRVDAVILLDGLHTSTLESPEGRAEMAPFVEFAKRSAQDESLMFVSHSSINPPAYVSTTQATNYLIWQVGGNPMPATRGATLPAELELHRRFDRAGFHALGFRGVGQTDHCAQVALYRHALQTYLLPRWGLGESH